MGPIMKMKMLLVAALLSAGVVQAADSSRIDLSGTWRYSFGKGPKNDTIVLPGTTDLAKKGPGKLFGQSVDAIDPASLLDNRGAVRHFARRYPSRGLVVYERDIEIPSSWAGSRVRLRIGGTRRAWLNIDGVRFAENRSFTTPYEVDLPAAHAGPGKHVLQVEVDNGHFRDTIRNEGAHQLTDETQTNWNGLLGELALVRIPPVALERLDPYPDALNRRVTCKIQLANTSAAAAKDTLEVACCGVVRRLDCTVPVGGTNVVVELALPPTTPLWDEFHPNLLRVKATFAQTEQERSFGLRTISTRGRQFLVNGRPTFLRGTHDGCVFPLTGHPPMEKGPWCAYFRQMKAWGLNHLRCHSWTPPEAAFAAADEVGIYIQAEFPAFGNGGLFAKDARYRDYAFEESTRIQDAYGHHPSFCFFTLGNEICGAANPCGEIVRRLRARDGRRLYASATNGDYANPKQNPQDDYWVTMRTTRGEAGNVRGSFAHVNKPLGGVQWAGAGTLRDFSSGNAKSTIPVVAHETGQFQVYPDYTEIPKFTGPLRPLNYEICRARLARTGMLDLADRFHMASGKLAAINYREEVEEALRTPQFGGFQLLDIKDFPGQGTALVGLWNAFLEPKRFTDVAWWRGFCSPTVALARFASHTGFAGTAFQAKLQVAHYGEQDVLKDELVWRLFEGDRTFAEGRQPFTAKVGELADLGGITFNLPDLGRAAACTLELRLAGLGTRNVYPIWAYPRKKGDCPQTSAVTNDLAAAERMLAEGRKVLCVIPSSAAPKDSVAGFFPCDFWNWDMFRRIQPGTLGLLIDEKHPALAGFPTSYHSDWQWKQLVEHARGFRLDGDPEAKIFVQGIDNITRNGRLGYVWEKRRGSGRLIVSSIDLLDPAVAALPEGQALFQSLAAVLVP